MHPVLQHIIRHSIRLSKKRRVRIGAAIVVLMMIAAVYSAKSSTQMESYLWTDVSRGNFQVLLTETGTLKSANSISIKAPNARQGLTILDIVPEGTIVKEGDFLLKFDSSSIESQVETQLEQFELAQMDLAATMERQKSNMSDLESNLTSANYSFDAAKLSLDLLKYESQVRQQTAQLNLEKARLSVELAEKQIESQKIIDAGDLHNSQFQVEQIQRRIDESKKQIEGMALRSPAPGLVVYEEISGFGAASHKVAIGDSPRPGTALITIPDQSHFLVTIKVNELDADKIQVGQDAYIRLDAYEDREFMGTVTTIAPMIEYKVTAATTGARIVLATGETQGVDEVPTYEATVLIDSGDPILNPGMTARVQIVLDDEPNSLYIRIGAVFEQPDGSSVVFTMKKYPDPVKVAVGRRNDHDIVIASGITENDQVALRPAVENINPTGWYLETMRRSSSVADVNTHIENMKAVGITGELIKPTIDLTTLPAFLQGIARMFEDEGEPLTQEQLAQLMDLQAGPTMNAELSKVLNENQLKFYDRMRQQGQTQDGGNQREMMMRQMQQGGNQVIIMGPGGSGGQGGFGGSGSRGGR